jgi:hypothetical protein
MKILQGCVVFMAFSLTTCAQHPIPSIQHVEHGAERQERPLPPPTVPRRKLDQEKLRAQADDLSKLAQSVSSDVYQAANGILLGLVFNPSVYTIIAERLQAAQQRAR